MKKKARSYSVDFKQEAVRRMAQATTIIGLARSRAFDGAGFYRHLQQTAPEQADLLLPTALLAHYLPTQPRRQSPCLYCAASDELFGSHKTWENSKILSGTAKG
jgi:hypothetical protein